MVNSSHLRTLVVRHLALDQVTMLLQHLDLPVLNKLTLVNIFDDTLTHCEEFRRVFNRDRLPALKTLHFLLRFPAHLHDTFQATVLNTFDGLWPFGQVALHLDEYLVISRFDKEVTKTVLLFYTLPLDTLLRYTRTVHNHSFVEYSTGIRQRSLKWRCNQTDSASQVTSTLNKLASGQISTLHFSFDKIKTLFTMDKFCPEQCFPRLRSVIFHFEPDFRHESARFHLVDQILHSSPRLEHLAVKWSDLRCCSRSNVNVKYLCLKLYEHSSDPNRLVDIGLISQLLPNLHSLETSYGHFAFNENLITFIVRLVDTFDQLVELIINSHGIRVIESDTRLMMERAIFNTGHRRLLDSRVCQIKFPKRDEIKIWLSTFR
ncbi:unnamed protein product [Adineta ricciae]|uniref:F-box domain-containing protein n=1 Tax=Adineta ricciae TaxID=249248 RepID=A0A815HU30_ADIRI|nr:unnamed protein product [Adineta ricciae]